MGLDMAYSKTDWLETAMSTGDKLTALDNLEGMYGELTTYIDAITHSGAYYTDAEAAAKFFSGSTDGSGSGLICATLDGQTAQQIIDAGSPSGVIAWWSGSEASIPSGWVLCNGLNSTPDLRNRFVPGAGSTYSRGDTGGADTASPTASAVTVGTHALTVAEIPAHTHGYTDYYRSSASALDNTGGYGGVASHNSNTSPGTSTAHGHTGSSFSGAATDTRPAFYALCYIMKE